MTLQKAWKASMAAIHHPVAQRASQLNLVSMRRDGRGHVFDLVGPLGAKDGKRLAVLLHHSIGAPVSMIIRVRAKESAVDCVECGAEIDPARRQAVPGVSLCYECACAKESRRG